jgi:hypothetical protein
MATLTQDRKAEIAEDLRRASSWVQGERRVKLLELAEEIEGTEPDKVDENVGERLDRLSRRTVPSEPAGPNGTTASSPPPADDDGKDDDSTS